MSEALPTQWHLAGGRRLNLQSPRVMAILNITPDSFFNGGVHFDVDRAVSAAAQAVHDGAAMLDIGGESTRPGAERVSAHEQIARIVPVIRSIRARGGALAEVPIAVDTTLAPVADEALDAGADAINDVAAGLEDPDLLPLAARRSAGVILMHRLVAPQHDSYSDQYKTMPRYDDVVAEVREFLAARLDAALSAGLPREAIIIDPGLGFGKTVEQNLELLRRTGELLSLGHHILSAVSRKSFVGRAMGLADSTPADRLPGSIAFSIMHYLAGARLFRVHDTIDHVHALSAAVAAAPAPSQ